MHNEKSTICHFTTLHPRDDVRIFYKQCCSIAKYGHLQPLLVVADGKGDAVLSGVHVFDIGFIGKNRFAKFFLGNIKMSSELVKKKADVYHFHDPELMFAGAFLRLLGKTVIYDVHEDLPKQLLSKPYLKEWQKKPLAAVVKFVENVACKFFKKVVCVTETIGMNFSEDKVVLVQNYPLSEEVYQEVTQPYLSRPETIVYAGGISEIRMGEEMVRAMNILAPKPECVLNLAGRFQNDSFYKKVISLAGWSRVRYHGLVSRTEMLGLFEQARVGLVLFAPVPNHLDSQPNKLFEYMSAGLPVIASNFPLWREIVLDDGVCGLLVDPLSPDEIANAIKWILDNPIEAKQMGEAGRAKVISKYLWTNEENKLITMYDELIPRKTTTQ